MFGPVVNNYKKSVLSVTSAHVTVADQCRFVIKGALPSNQWSAMQNKSNVQRFQILQYLKVGWESL